jgi:glutamine synthetase
MPKPIAEVNGSGMHCHQSLWRDGENAFFSEEDVNHLSDTAKKFLAGLLSHAREITVVTNQWVNSYKRLIPGYEAPVYVSWAEINRSDLVRIPSYREGTPGSVRMEYRAPDPACNPYLAFTVMLYAGLTGIENDYELQPATESNVYKMSEQERAERGITTLPGSLREAVYIAEKSDVLREALGQDMFDVLIENKKIEWDHYRSQVTSWELDTYLPVL